MAEEEKPPLGAENDLGGDENKNEMAKVGTDDDTPEFEDLIDHLGAFGHWQRVIFFVICIADIWGAMAIVVPVIVGATPKFRCTSESEINSTDATNTSSGWALNQCPQEGDTNCTRFVFEDDFTSVVSQWSLVCDKKYVSDLITTVQMAGLMFGAFACGSLSDIVGRWKAYLVAFLFLIIPGFISAFVPMWQLYAGARFLVGVGYGSLMVVNCVYPLEFVGSRWRTLCGTIGFWAIGIMLLALLGYLVREWTHLVMVTSASGLIYILCFIFLPESPRWLTQKYRLKDAYIIVKKIAEKNHKTVPDISVLQRIADKSNREDSRLKKYTYLDLFRNWRYCKVAIIMAIQWFSVFLMYYELSFNLRTFSGNRYLNLFLSGFVDLTSMLSVILFNNWLGRKKTLALYLIVAVCGNLGLIFIYVAQKQVHLSGLVLTFALIGKASALGGTYVCGIFSAELFPTVIRNQGLGTGAVAGRIGGMLSPQLVFLGLSYVLAPHILTSILCCLCLPLIIFLPETNGQPLEDSFVPAARGRKPGTVEHLPLSRP